MELNLLQDGADDIYKILECIKITANSLNRTETEVISAVFHDKELSISQNIHKYTIPLEKLLSATLWWDWRKIGKRTRVANLDVLILPKNTVLFHGTSIHFPDRQLPHDASFYGALDTALRYSFETSPSDDPRDYGKILTFKTHGSMTILLTTRYNFKKLLPKFKEIYSVMDKKGDFERLLHIAYENWGSRTRYSTRFVDNIINGVFCEYIRSNPIFSGYGDTEYVSFHDEVVFCKNTNLIRLDYTYRFDRDFPDCIFILKNGSIISRFHLNSTDKTDVKLYAKNYMLNYDRKTDKNRLSELDDKIGTEYEDDCNRNVDKRESMYPIMDDLGKLIENL